MTVTVEKIELFTRLNPIEVELDKFLEHVAVMRDNLYCAEGSYGLFSVSPSMPFMCLPCRFELRW